MTSKLTKERIEWLNYAATGLAANGTEMAMSPQDVIALTECCLAAMDSEPVELPLDYLQGHKDGLEWAAQLAKANHPETGDWLYDDPIELAKAISKGPDMPPSQPALDGEPVAWIVHARTGDQLTTDGGYVSNAEGILGLHSTPLYRHAQPAPAFPDFDDVLESLDYEVRCNAWESEHVLKACQATYDACRAAMLAAADCSIPMISDRWIPVSERMPEVGVKVLAFPVEDEPIHAIFNGQLWLQDISWSSSDEPIDNVIPRNVTHWMPLPAAPQEVKGD